MHDFLPGFLPPQPRALRFDAALPQAVLDIDGKSRTSGFAWRGQFSPQLVESLLQAYCRVGAHVLDPFSGSGTILAEAARLGLRASAFEINPAAWLLTRVYTLCNVPDTERETALAALLHLLADLWKKGDADMVQRGLQNLAKEDGPSGIVAGAFVILLDLFENRLSRERCNKVFPKLAQSVRDLPFSTEPLQAVRGDARAMPLPDASVGFVLTSPPYINVFNYHQHYRRSAELLGHDLLLTARSEIGSNRANRGNRFLTVIQYCLDMAATLKEVRRVCSANARVIFVVGHESNVLGVPFLNAELISQLAENTDSFKSVLRQTRWYTNKFGARIREDLLHFEPKVGKAGGWEDVARKAADAALRTGLLVVPEKNRAALEDAINRAGATHGTPLLVTNEQADTITNSASREAESLPGKLRNSRRRHGAAENGSSEIRRVDQGADLSAAR